MAVGGLPPNWCFGEVMGFDDELLAFVPKPVLAVIINAQYQKRAEEKVKGSKEETVHDWYMHQTGTLDNACGVIACIHAIYNNLGADKITLEDGKVLKNFFNGSDSKSAAERCAFLEGYKEFQ